MDSGPTIEDEDWVRHYLADAAGSSTLTAKGPAPILSAVRRRRRAAMVGVVLGMATLVAAVAVIVNWPSGGSPVAGPEPPSDPARVELPVVAETRFMSQALLDGGTLEIDHSGCATYQTPDRTIDLAWGPGWAAVRDERGQWRVEGPDDMTIADGDRVTLVGGFEGDQGCNGENAWAVGTVERP